jgi:hypothetical protein
MEYREDRPGDGGKGGGAEADERVSKTRLGLFRGANRCELGLGIEHHDVRRR